MATKQQIINSIETNHTILNDKITKGLEEFNNYLECFKEEKFEEDPNEDFQQTIKRAESIFDRLDEMIKRNDSLNENAKETIEILKKMADLFNGIVKNTEDEKEKLAVRNNELIDIIIDLEKRKTNKLIDQNQKRKNALKGVFEDRKEEWDGLRIETEKMKQQEEIKKIMNTIIDNDGIKQLEEWTGLKIGNIIFDSNIDNWNVNTSVFDQRIINKSNLILIIEDKDDNKFGGYINAKIDKVGDWINDPKSFVFSLKSNGRLDGMMKFDIKDSQHALGVWNKSNGYLFTLGIGGDICILKENNKNQSFCKHYSFNYNRNQDVFCGKYNFTPKRITAIQLI